MKNDSVDTPRVRIVIADDQEVVRVGWTTILQSFGFRVVSTVGDGNDLIAAVKEHRPDVAIVDVRMPNLDGLSAIEHLFTTGHVGRDSCRVIIVTTFDHDEYLARALRAGAVGFLLKTATAIQLRTAVENALEGESTLSPSATTKLIDNYLAGSTEYDESILYPLTDRERHVLKLVGFGLSNQEICERLHVAPNTLKTHVSRLLSKLGARDRAQLVVAAHKSGLSRVNEHHPER
jgi:DNA-binding NarL/FixJ family response regulator